MKIYSMTATFGKLSHQTLSLEPGLNVIHAPNEWGKSTWCAFLVAMLYGIDTRERNKQGSLADKERYAPWSGEPMSGRIALCWKGRDITIERSTKGRTVFGEFRAYETATGLPVAELTAANCGQQLLGVEKSVFTRAGFIRMSDMPVSEDDALRRRLNALVTTGDESGASDTLAQKLKDLKNRCRHNRTGLLPQAETQRAELRNRLEQLEALQRQIDQLTLEQDRNDKQIEALANHSAALEYAAAQQDRHQLEQANAAKTALAEKLKALQTQCLVLPTAQEAQERLMQLLQLQQTLSELQEQERALPPQPEVPGQKAPFYDADEQQIRSTLEQDTARYQKLKNSRGALPYWIIGAIGILAGATVALVAPHLWALGIALGVATLIPLGVYAIAHRDDLREAAALEEKYGANDPAKWTDMAEAYLADKQAYSQALARYTEVRKDFDLRSQAARKTLEESTGGAPLAQVQQRWESVRQTHADRDNTEREYKQACRHADAIGAMVREVPAPTKEDSLTLTAQQTAIATGKALALQEQLANRAGQCQGQMETLGQSEVLQKQLDDVQSRIDRLEDLYAAADLALKTLAEASANLQRKFAPRISQRAQALFAKLTGDRYDRLVLDEDLSLQAAARDEDVLRSGLWRSEGTTDQLYLALRLAVAEELTPQAPLVLDDALVRFDDDRLQEAMAILQAAAEEKQVILFTCQGREKQYL